MLKSIAAAYTAQGSDAAAPADGVGAAAAASTAHVVVSAVPGEEQQPDQRVAVGAAAAAALAQDEQEDQDPHQVIVAKVHVSILLCSGVPSARIHHSTYFPAILCVRPFP